MWTTASRGSCAASRGSPVERGGTRRSTAPGEAHPWACLAPTMGRMAAPRIGLVGATGAVGTITLELLAERGYDTRAFASARSAGSRLPFGDDEILVEEATHEALAAGDVD